MVEYRIVPRRGTYKVEQIEPHGQPQVVGTWRTEDEAVSHLRKLQDEARHADYKPMPGEVGWPAPKR